MPTNAARVPQKCVPVPVASLSFSAVAFQSLTKFSRARVHTRRISTVSSPGVHGVEFSFDPSDLDDGCRMCLDDEADVPQTNLKRFMPDFSDEPVRFLDPLDAVHMYIKLAASTRSGSDFSTELYRWRHASSDREPTHAAILGLSLIHI